MLIPRANRLLSYVGRLTIARTSPVCGFIAITTPRLRPIAFIAHLSAFWASCCTLVSIVSVSESPGWTWVSVRSTWVFWPRALRSTVSVP